MDSCSVGRGVGVEGEWGAFDVNSGVVAVLVWDVVVVVGSVYDVALMVVVVVECTELFVFSSFRTLIPLCSLLSPSSNA